MQRFLVTGADGFVGTALCSYLDTQNSHVTRVCRRGDRSQRDAIAVGDFRRVGNWDELLSGADIVIHLAARAHILRETAADPQTEFSGSNVEPTVKITEAAIRCGVRRLVFVSTIGVHGTSTSGEAITERSAIAPADPYSRSKWQAERALRRLCSGTKMEYAIVRPTLIYGPGAKGNFLRLIKLVHRGLPIPLRAVNNRRSFLDLEDFCLLLVLCATKPQAARQVYVAAGLGDLSTPELLELIAEAMGKRILVPDVPLPFVRACAALCGKTQALEKLTQSLQVDANRARQELGWNPKPSPREGLRKMVESFLAHG